MRSRIWIGICGVVESRAVGSSGCEDLDVIYEGCGGQSKNVSKHIRVVWALEWWEFTGR